MQIPLFFKIYLFIHLTERERAQAGGTADGDGEAGSPLSSDAGLDPRLLGS